MPHARITSTARRVVGLDEPRSGRLGTGGVRRAVVAAALRLVAPQERLHGWLEDGGRRPGLGLRHGRDLSPEVKFKAHNAKTAFYDTGSTPGQYVKLSRNAFFKRVREHHAIDIRWAWRYSAKSKIRYIKSIRGIIAGA